MSVNWLTTRQKYSSWRGGNYDCVAPQAKACNKGGYLQRNLLLLARNQCPDKVTAVCCLLVRPKLQGLPLALAGFCSCKAGRGGGSCECCCKTGGGGASCSSTGEAWGWVDACNGRLVFWISVIRALSSVSWDWLPSSNTWNLLELFCTFLFTSSFPQLLVNGKVRQRCHLYLESKPKVSPANLVVSANRNIGCCSFRVCLLSIDGMEPT